MKVKSMFIAVLASLFIAGSAMAQMGGGMMGISDYGNSGQPGGGWQPGGGFGCQGPGYGMGGAGSMKSYMFGGTMAQGYLEILNPITSPDEAITAI